jgi:glycosyltransferase involved in cell wall biosynthesis
MCTYNGAANLQEQLDSFCAQTVLPEELVVCDDTSTDNSAEILKEFKARAPFPVNLVINKVNLGMAKNSEQAYGLATQEIIIGSDQDDIWLPEKAEIILRAFEENPNAEYVFSDGFILQNGQIQKESMWDRFFKKKGQKLFSKGRQFDAIILGNFASGCTSAVRKSFFLRCCPMNEILYPDHWFAVNAAIKNSMLAIGKKLIKYRIHAQNTVGVGGGSVSRSQKRKQIEGFCGVHIDEEIAKITTGRQHEKIQALVTYSKTREKAFGKNFFLRCFILSWLFLRGYYFRFSFRPFGRFAADIFKVRVHA